MLLLDMLTVDAAAKHGRLLESAPPRRPPSPAENGSFFAHMPLSILGSMLRKQSPSPSPAPAPAPAPADAPSPAPPPAAQLDDSPAAAPDASLPHRSLMSAAREAPPTSPAASRPASSGSTASGDFKPTKRRPPRPRTTYNLANPPPTNHPRAKLHLRPRVLLQLHQVLPSQRPRPVYEVVPFALLGARSTRRLARTFNSREKLCHDDLLIVKADEYRHDEEDARSDEEQWGTREVAAIIRPGREEKSTVGRTEICMDDGSSWDVSNMPNGGYEFTYTDHHGLTLRRRWVPKSPHVRRVSTMSNTTQASPALGEDKKFSFSTISANSRRHPIIATMSRSSIQVLDSYTMPSATSPSTPSQPSSNQTPAATPSSIDMHAFLDDANDRLPVITDDALRRFITISGVWVAFSENWSPAYSSSKSQCCPSPLVTSSTFRTAPPNRSISMTGFDVPRSSSPASASTTEEASRASTFPNIFRSTTQKLHRNASIMSTPSSGATSPPVKTRGRRSNSTGNAELNGRAGSTKKRFGLALEDQTLAETEEERQTKRSSEMMRMRELALSPSLASPAPHSSAQTSAPTPRIVEPLSSPQSGSPRSPPLIDSRSQKAKSAYNPVTTAGLWDSGVTEGPGLKARPTSMVIVNEKKNKENKKKQSRSRSLEKMEKMEKKKKGEGLRKSERFVELLKDMKDIFHKEKNSSAS